MSYIYFFRSLPQENAPMPEGCTEVKLWQEPGYESGVKCDVHGYVRFSRPLSTEELIHYELIPDPRSLTVGVMLG